ncbi:acyl-CoA thioesterase [Opitutaceae bacterium TAV4]|nr:acyl-CoA thioesterase [Opitutaceae bacterium TAV4]RRJ99272.1 acyl-CoA thioesterase [Opitutaceae bacterium TAV3]
MSFTYQRTIHFPDTDAAGVVFFARYLSICHEAYEEALGAASEGGGLVLAKFFADNGVVVPIARCEAKYLRPLVCGDRVEVVVRPEGLSENSFAVDYVMSRLDRSGAAVKRVAVARTEHVCIGSATRERMALPAALAAWVAAG